MVKKSISPPELGPTFDIYNKGMQVGNRLFISGQVPWDADGAVVGPGDLEAQTQRVLGNIETVLQEAGMSVDDLAMTRAWTTSVQYRNAIGAARRSRSMDRATSTLAVVHSHVDPLMMLEIAGIAHTGSERQVIVPKTVHATPGTYSHAVRVDETVYVAGQIALDPDGNLVGPGDPAAQADQAAQNLVRVLDAAGASPDDLVYTCLYITNPAFIQPLREARKKYGLFGQPTTLLVVPSLATADFLVEIEAIAVVGAEKRIIRPIDVHDVSARYEHAVVAGDMIYTAGQVGAALDGSIVGVGDPVAQAEKLFDNMRRVLAAAGATFNDVVNTTTYMTNLQYRQAINDARRAAGLTHATNSSVVVSALYRPEVILEVEAIATFAS